MEQGSDWIQHVQAERESLGWESPCLSLMMESGGLVAAEWMERLSMTVLGAETHVGCCLVLFAVQLYYKELCPPRQNRSI